MKYKKLCILDVDLYKFKILKLLVDTYVINFGISVSEANAICLVKVNELYSYIGDEEAIVIGAIKDNELVAFIWLYTHDYFGEKRLHVNQIVVDNDFRGNKIGKYLINEAEKYALQIGINTIDLFVSEINETALKLYNGLGFKTERRYMKKYFGR